MGKPVESDLKQGEWLDPFKAGSSLPSQHAPQVDWMNSKPYLCELYSHMVIIQSQTRGSTDHTCGISWQRSWLKRKQEECIPTRLCAGETNPSWEISICPLTGGPGSPARTEALGPQTPVQALHTPPRLAPWSGHAGFPEP